MFSDRASALDAENEGVGLGLDSSYLARLRSEAKRRRVWFRHPKQKPEEDLYFKELFSDYEEYHATSKISTLSILRANLISDWIKPYSSVLDVGCGEGFFMEFLSRTKNCKVYGMDVSKKAIENVRSRAKCFG